MDYVYHPGGLLDEGLARGLRLIELLLQLIGIEPHLVFVPDVLTDLSLVALDDLL